MAWNKWHYAALAGVLLVSLALGIFIYVYGFVARVSSIEILNYKSTYRPKDNLHIKVHASSLSTARLSLSKDGGQTYDQWQDVLTNRAIDVQIPEDAFSANVIIKASDPGDADKYAKSRTFRVEPTMHLSSDSSNPIKVIVPGTHVIHYKTQGNHVQKENLKIQTGDGHTWTDLPPSESVNIDDNGIVRWTVTTAMLGHHYVRLTTNNLALQGHPRELEAQTKLPIEFTSTATDSATAGAAGDGGMQFSNLVLRGPVDSAANTFLPGTAVDMTYTLASGTIGTLTWTVSIDGGESFDAMEGVSIVTGTTYRWTIPDTVLSSIQVRLTSNSTSVTTPVLTCEPQLTLLQANPVNDKVLEYIVATHGALVRGSECKLSPGTFTLERSHTIDRGYNQQLVLYFQGTQPSDLSTLSLTVWRNDSQIMST